MRVPCAVFIALLLAAGSDADDAAGFSGSDDLRQPVAAGNDALPRLALDNLPAVLRASLQAAYDVARARPADPSAVGELAMPLHAHEQYRAADQCYLVVRQRDTTSAMWPYLSGVVQGQLGEYPAAAASFRRALQLDPDYLPARIGLADALFESGDLDAGADRYAALSASDPRVHFGLGAASRFQGVAVEWPDGSKEAWSGLRADRLVVLKQRTGVRQR